MTYWSLLGPTTVHPNPNRIPGGKPNVTAEDVRLAVSSLKGVPFLFGMAAFLDCHRSRLKLTRFFEEMLLDYGLHNGWIRQRVDTGRRDVHSVRALAELVIFEATKVKGRHETFAHQERLPEGSLVTRCPVCHGKGKVADEVCPMCRRKRRRTADGRLVISDDFRRDFIGVRQDEWKKAWRGRYSYACEIPVQWERIADAHVAKRLRP